MVWWSTLSISRLRIEKRGDNVTMSVKANGGELHPLGSIKLALREPFYIGLGVCSHNKGRGRNSSLLQCRVQDFDSWHIGAGFR
jgi:hypothetical protein